MNRLFLLRGGCCVGLAAELLGVSLSGLFFVCRLWASLCCEIVRLSVPTTFCGGDTQPTTGIRRTVARLRTL